MANLIGQKQKFVTGFSLVELMVAMVMSLFLSAGLFSMFTMSATNVTTTSQFNQLQENGRIALALIERDISQLGFMGDMTGTDFILGTNTQIPAGELTMIVSVLGQTMRRYPIIIRLILGVSGVTKVG